MIPLEKSKAGDLLAQQDQMPNVQKVIEGLLENLKNVRVSALQPRAAVSAEVSMEQVVRLLKDLSNRGNVLSAAQLTELRTAVLEMSNVMENAERLLRGWQTALEDSGVSLVSGYVANSGLLPRRLLAQG